MDVWLEIVRRNEKLNIISNHFILGISCFYHDSAASLIRDGETVAEVQEERFAVICID